MAPSLKDKGAERLAREVAALAGETLMDTIRNAPSERLRRGQRADLAEHLRKIGEGSANLPNGDTRSPDEIVGYDENGMRT